MSINHVLIFPARGRGIRYGAELRNPGCSEYQAYAGAPRSLSTEFTGKPRLLSTF